MGTLYTPKELARIYNGIKIRCNPTGYSFRDRLVEDANTSTMRDKQIYTVGFSSENVLLGRIMDYWGIADGKFTTYGMCNIHTGIWKDYITHWKDLQYKNFLLATPTKHADIFVDNDNLNFNPTKICMNLGISDKDFKKLKLLDSFITACYLCKSSNSISADLKYATTEMPAQGYTYENMHSLQHLKDALEAKDDAAMRLELDESPFYSINCPVPPMEFLDNPTETFADYTGYRESQTTATPPSEAYKMFLECMYYETITFGLELVYLINKYTDTKENAKIYELLTGSMAKTANELTSLIYQAKKDVFIPAIDLPDSPPERFTAITSYIYSGSVREAVQAMCSAFMARTNYTCIPSMFGAVVSYARGFSMRTIRIKQCAILYNYCKAQGLLDSKDTVLEEASDDSPAHMFSSILEEAAGESGGDEKNMLDLSPRKSSGTTPASSTGHDSSTVSQALDGLIGNFRTDKYGFTVKDVYSDDEDLKERYEAIASKIKLVNSQLIKQIRDIKTYNVGGKYPGLKSGKIDRKNLYKYKTNKDIFYQNTYKQKECDLAFGIVLDASGSMSGHGILDGKTTMIVLHETLKALGINHSIIDHTCYGSDYTSDLRRYQCFREDKGYRVRKNYALAGITAESGNCDSGALWFMEKALLRTRNRDKICLIFSDGAPTECSGSDLIEQVKHMEKHGIKVIGIGIGFPNISRYYSEYANGNNLKQMLDIVASILKEYVLTKKE